MLGLGGFSGTLGFQIDTINLFTAQQVVTYAAITSTSNSIAWNLNSAQNATHTLTENTTLANPTNMKSGGNYKFRVKQHASAAKTLAFGSAYRDPSGLPLISTALNAVDVIEFDSDGTIMSLIGSSFNVG